MSNVVCVIEEDHGDAETSLDLEDGEEGDMALADSFQAFHSLRNAAALFEALGKKPQALSHGLHGRGETRTNGEMEDGKTENYLAC
jgi:hypothetical protein